MDVAVNPQIFHSFYLFIEDSEHVGFGQIIEAAPYWLRCYSFLSVVYMTVYVHVIKSFIDVIYYLSIYIYIYIYTICDYLSVSKQHPAMPGIAFISLLF